jgi:uncharacterized phage protein (TIGR01671 family)
MREIKFRAWDTKNKKMGQPTDFRTPGGAIALYNSVGTYPDTDFPPHWPKPSELVFLQFTGLQDKNGKEIYEGDVIWVRGGTRHEVRFTAGRFECSHWDLGGRKAADIKIIGNIYENPELLK